MNNNDRTERRLRVLGDSVKASMNAMDEVYGKINAHSNQYMLIPTVFFIELFDKYSKMISSYGNMDVEEFASTKLWTMLMHCKERAATEGMDAYADFAENVRDFVETCRFIDAYNKNLKTEEHGTL